METERVKYWENIIKSEVIQQGLEEDLLSDLQVVKDSECIDSAITLLDVLVHGLPLVECPLVALNALVEIITAGDRLSVHAFKGLILLYVEYSANVSNIYELLYNLLTVELLTEESELLLLLVNDLLYSRDVSIATVKSFAKRLSYLSIRVNIYVTYKILNILSIILNKHKTINRKESSCGRSVKPLLITGSIKREQEDDLVQADKAYTENTRMNDPAVDYYLYELDALKDHPVLNVYAREIKQNKIVEVESDEITKKILSLVQ